MFYSEKTETITVQSKKSKSMKEELETLRFKVEIIKLKLQEVLEAIDSNDYDPVEPEQVDSKEESSVRSSLPPVEFCSPVPEPLPVVPELIEKPLRQGVMDFGLVKLVPEAVAAPVAEELKQAKEPTEKFKKALEGRKKPKQAPASDPVEDFLNL
jgi:hypothetical protein